MLMIELSMKQVIFPLVASSLNYFNFSVYINTVKIVLCISKLTRVIDETVTERIERSKRTLILETLKHQAIKQQKSLYLVHSLTHFVIFDLFDGTFFV